MSRKNDLVRLHMLGQLVLDARLGCLTATAAALQHSRDQLAGLDQPAAPSGDLPEAAAELAALTYQRWADLRRTEIALVMARQTAEWIEARDAARIAFGRTEALHALRTRLKP